MIFRRVYEETFTLRLLRIGIGVANLIDGIVTICTFGFYSSSFSSIASRELAIARIRTGLGNGTRNIIRSK